jgi:hypothetical protein
MAFRVSVLNKPCSPSSHKADACSEYGISFGEASDRNTTTMKILRLFKFVITLGFVVSASAQTLPVITRLTVQQQGFTSANGGIFTDRVTTTKLTSFDLLQLLARAYATNFPAGFPFDARLVLVNYGYFQVQAGDGSILVTNASKFLSYSDTYVEDDFLYQGREDTITGALNYTYFYRSTIQFNDLSTNGTSFTFSGNTQERYSRSTEDPDGFRLFQGSLLINGTGSGKAGTNFFLLSGRISTPIVRWIDAMDSP